MNQEIHSLLRSRSEAFSSGNSDLYRKSRYDIRKAIRDAKGQYHTNLETQTNHIDTRHLGQGLHDITGYKAKLNRIVGNSTSLPDELNAFEACFEQKGSEMMSPIPTARDVPALSATTADVGSAFLRVNPQKVTGPVRAPSRGLGSCVDQLVGVYADIFHLSLARCEVPTCFKMTFIISVPKKNHAACLNDNHPAPLTSIIMKCFERMVTAHINSRLTDCLHSPTIHTTICLLMQQVHSSKTKELVIDIRKQNGGHVPVCINGAEVEMDESIKFLA
eukprot:g42482.t1